jgi:ribonucleoside-triphosphate reductase
MALSPAPPAPCRSALISLSDLSDGGMRDAKSGPWWADHAHRAMANNSAVYTEKPSVGTFLQVSRQRAGLGWAGLGC